MNLITNESNYDEIRVLDFPESVRSKYGMYLDSPTSMLREIIDNSTDEVLSSKVCNLIIVDNKNYGGYNVVCDQGRGIPIYMSKDREGMTQVDVGISVLHSGSKFTNNDAKIGTYGIGSAAVNALSSDFWVLSKITQENYDKSLPVVKSFYESLGPRSKRDVFYYVHYQRGYKISEGAAKKRDLEMMMGLPKELPADMSTIVTFQVDTTIFPDPRTSIPVENLTNFLFIQEKFYRRKVTVVANDVVLTSAGVKPYAYEIIKTITPSDPSKNPYLGIYVTFEIDPTLSPKSCKGSVNGLVVDSGAHISAIETCYTEALKAEYKITHKTIFPGLRMFVILLAEDLVYDSQIKSRLKSISKVKQSDFAEITKEFQKIFRKNDDYWRPHVNKLNALAESYRSIGAVEKAQKMIDASKGNSSYRMKGQNYVEGFSDATSQNRWDCELFLCFTGETEMLTRGEERISMIDLVKRIESGEEIYTTSCDSSGNQYSSKVIAAKEIKKAYRLCEITLDNGESFRCTPDHKMMMKSGEYKEAEYLVPGDIMMDYELTLGLHKEIRVKEVKLILSELGKPVYCLEVDSPDHNFPLAAGIFAKNCEGLSAAGGLKSGRKSTLYHAVLPLRGKILNVKDSTVDEILANKEIFTMLSTIGLGIDINFVGADKTTPEETYAEIQKHARYGKIIIATD